MHAPISEAAWTNTRGQERSLVMALRYNASLLFDVWPSLDKAQFRIRVRGIYRGHLVSGYHHFCSFNTLALALRDFDAPLRRQKRVTPRQTRWRLYSVNCGSLHGAKNGELTLISGSWYQLLVCKATRSKHHYFSEMASPQSSSQSNPPGTSWVETRL